MVSRIILNSTDYDAFMRKRFYLDKETPTYTDIENQLYERLQRLCDAICLEVSSRGLSYLYDINVIFDFFGTKIVFVQFCGQTQSVAEEIACLLLQKDEWSDCAVVLSPGDHKELISGGDAAAITKEGIYIRSNDSCA